MSRNFYRSLRIFSMPHFPSLNSVADIPASAIPADKPLPYLLFQIGPHIYTYRREDAYGETFLFTRQYSILCHNNGYEIENYLPVLLESAIAEGYRFVTVDALLLTGDTIIDVNGVQKQA